MVFLTGCDSIPPLGFGQPSICFVEDSGSILPTISTCSLTLRFPCTMPATFEEFREKMHLAILGSQGLFWKDLANLKF